MSHQIKILTKRSRGQSHIEDSAVLQRTIYRLRGVGVAPRGVHRFPSHEEAQQWQIRQMARIHARQKSKTS